MFLLVVAPKSKNGCLVGVRFELYWRHYGAIIIVMDNEHRCNLRLTAEAYEAIDFYRKRLPGSVSRNTWIASAIQEKIDRDCVKMNCKAGGNEDA